MTRCSIESSAFKGRVVEPGTGAISTGGAPLANVVGKTRSCTARTLAPWLVSVKRATPVSTVTNTSWVTGALGGRSVELTAPGMTGAAGWGVTTPAGGMIGIRAGTVT